MPLTLEKVVPWGRCWDEYRRMFSLDSHDCRGRVLGCADGPASFNAEATEKGCQVVSCDPLYAFRAEEIRRQIAVTSSNVLAQARQHRADYVWDVFASVEELGRARHAAMDKFLADYDAGKREGRYVAAELPAFPFEDSSFDLVLCSHFLFLYEEQLGLDFHEAAVTELCRVAREIRIFPIVNMSSRESSFLPAVISLADARGMVARIEDVDYEFQRGAHQMLRILPA